MSFDQIFWNIKDNTFWLWAFECLNWKVNMLIKSTLFGCIEYECPKIGNGLENTVQLSQCEYITVVQWNVGFWMISSKLFCHKTFFCPPIFLTLVQKYSTIKYDLI